MAYGLGDNTSGSNNTPLGARRRVISKTEENPPHRGTSETFRVKKEAAENPMEQVDSPAAETVNQMKVPAGPGRGDEPKAKRGRSTQRGLSSLPVDHQLLTIHHIV